MKKKLLILVPMMFLIVGCSWFKKSNEDLEKVYVNLLKGELTYVNMDNEEKYLSDLNKGVYKIEKFAYVDFDGDDSIEMIVQYTESGERYHIIFSNQGSTIYGYDIRDIKVNSINRDGFISFEGEDMYGWLTYGFKKTNLNKYTILQYDINGKNCMAENESISCENYEEYNSKFTGYKAKDVKWTKYSA